MTAIEDNTRKRLLDQAERLFAEKGFAGTSVREITAAAECNVAGVNYHFGSKQNLYMAVFQERWASRAMRLQQGFAAALAGLQDPGLSDVIAAMARAFLEGPWTDEERRNHIQLMQRELSDPGQALGMIVEKVMRPYIREVKKLIRACLRREVDDEQLEIYILSMLGVVLYFFLARPAVTEILHRKYDQDFKSDLVAHITAFCLNGIEALNQEK